MVACKHTQSKIYEMYIEPDYIEPLIRIDGAFDPQGSTSTPSIGRCASGRPPGGPDTL